MKLKFLLGILFLSFLFSNSVLARITIETPSPLPVFDAPKVDFVVENLVLPTTAEVGKEVILSFKIFNRGNKTFLWKKHEGNGVAFTVDYSNQLNGFDTTERLISNGCSGRVDLRPNTSCLVRLGLTFNTSGIKKIPVTADYVNYVEESDEDNNITLGTVTITQPISNASLKISRDPSIVSQTHIRGKIGVNAVGIKFLAEKSDLKVRKIVLTGYVRDTGSGLFSKGTNGQINVSNSVVGIKLHELETGNVVASFPSSNLLGSSTGTVTFENISWDLKAGVPKTLVAYLALSSNSTKGESDYVAFDIDQTTHVEAFDASSKLVQPTQVDPNGATNPVTSIEVRNNGKLISGVSPVTPPSHSVYWGQQKDTLGVWRFSAIYEGFYLDKVPFGPSDIISTEKFVMANNIKRVYLQYKNKAGNSIISDSRSVDSHGMVNFQFAGDTRPYVPAEGFLEMTLKADFNGGPGGATVAQFKPAFRLRDINFFIFKATGELSGAVLGDTATGIKNEPVNMITTQIAFPKFQVSLPSTFQLSAGGTVLKLIIKSEGSPNSVITFSKNDGSILKFDVTGVGLSPKNFIVRDDMGTVVGTGILTSINSLKTTGKMIVDFNIGTLQIPSGSASNLTFHLSSVQGISQFHMTLPNAAGAVVWGASAGSFSTNRTLQPGTLTSLPVYGPFLTGNSAFNSLGRAFGSILKLIFGIW